MSCYHPLYGWRLRNNEDKKVHITSDEAPGELYRLTHPEKEFLQLPCGKCIGCRLDYSRQWADRCMLEAKEWEFNQFITLTYETSELTYNTCVDVNSGEVLGIPTLVPEHLTKFMKDLRRYYKYHYGWEDIRFYACGEYGSLHGRPHFHIIAFNLPIYDKVFKFKNEQGDSIYVSKTIEQIWGRGIVSIGNVTWNSAAYVARYVVKKQKGETKGIVDWSQDRLMLAGLQPEFTRMSRKEGIGRKYYEDNREKIYGTDEIVITNNKGLAKVIRPPKYYDKLYDVEYPDDMALIKKKRVKMADNAMKLQLSKTSLSEKEYLQLKERNKQESIKRLKRAVD